MDVGLRNMYRNYPTFPKMSFCRRCGPLVAVVLGRLVVRAPRAQEEKMLAPMLDAKGTKILAKSLFKELHASGYTANQILGLSTELIDLVTQDLRAQGEVRAAGGNSSEATAF
jgi:hypothetical protein